MVPSGAWPAAPMGRGFDGRERLAGAEPSDCLTTSMKGESLGLATTPTQIAAWNISVGSDGVGLPPGKGTPAAGTVAYE